MTTIIVTDLTRFNNQDIVCTAGIDMESGACIRPMPYLKASDCQRLNILPGAILSGEFTPSAKRQGPHQEDMDYKNLKFLGPCTAEDFRAALEMSLFPSVAAGFEMDFAVNQKCLPVEHKVARSIITIKVDNNNIEVLEDAYNPEKVKLSFTDNSGRQFRYLPITDLGFYKFSEMHRQSKKLNELNRFIRSQPDIYLRIGLARPWNNGGGEALWMQANGIYTFPEYSLQIRSYK